jgi:CRP/FNR family transcriptional regulator, cyclic AMP receptor protein
MAERLPRTREPLPLTLAVARGRAVVRQGQHCDSIWTVESGALMATSITFDGKIVSIDVLGPGSAIGEPGATSPVTVRALRPCRLRPARPSAVPALLAARAERVMSLACDLAWLDVEGRLRRRLADLAERFGRPVEGGVRIPLRLSQEDLGALTGSSRESVNRALRRMELDGQIERGSKGRYTVRGLPAYRQLTG